MVWREFNKAVILQTIVRQNNDQKTLKDVLMALSKKQSGFKISNGATLQTINNMVKVCVKECKKMASVFPSHLDECNHNSNY